MTRSAPLGPELAALLLAAAGSSEASPGGGHKSATAARPAKNAPHFPSLLGDLVENGDVDEKKEKPGTLAVAAPPVLPTIASHAPLTEDPARSLLGPAIPEPLSPAANGGEPEDSQEQNPASGKVQPVARLGNFAPVPVFLPVGSADSDSTATLAGDRASRNSEGLLGVCETAPASPKGGIPGDSDSPEPDTHPPALDGLNLGSRPSPPAVEHSIEYQAEQGCAEPNAPRETDGHEAPRPSPDHRALNNSDRPRTLISGILSAVAPTVAQTGSHYRTESPKRPASKHLFPTDSPSFPSDVEPLPPASRNSSELLEPAEWGDDSQRPNHSGPQMDSNLPPPPARLAFAARLVEIPPQPALSGEPAHSAHPLASPPANGKVEESVHPAGRPVERTTANTPGNGQPEHSTGEIMPASATPSHAASVTPLVPGQVQDRAHAALPETGQGPPLTSRGAPPSEFTAKPEGAPSPPARDIRLQLNQGEQRVDVRLSERSGEVHIAVRTPDPQLAGALRADLPRLSARLEQTGFRTETWHAGAAAGAERRVPTLESSDFHPPDGGHSQPRQGGQQQQQSQPRHPKPGGSDAARNLQRKEFQWLMSQLP